MLNTDKCNLSEQKAEEEDKSHLILIKQENLVINWIMKMQQKQEQDNWWEKDWGERGRMQITSDLNASLIFIEFQFRLISPQQILRFSSLFGSGKFPKLLENISNYKRKIKWKWFSTKWFSCQWKWKSNIVIEYFLPSGLIQRSSRCCEKCNWFFQIQIELYLWTIFTPFSSWSVFQKKEKEKSLLK